MNRTLLRETAFRMTPLAAASVTVFVTLWTPPTAQADVLTRLTSLATGPFSQDGGGAEVPAFDPASRKMFVVNAVNQRIDTADLTNPAAPTNLPGTLSLTLDGVGTYVPNSIAVRKGVLAVAFQNPVKTSPGEVAFFRASDNAFLTRTTVGALPDMLTFTPDGTRLLIANEGEPNSYGQSDSVDPEGSVSVLDVSFPSFGQVSVNANTTVGFTSFNGQEAALNTAGVRIFGPGASVAQDLEPEYIAVSPDGTKAFVALQENNAFATIDLATNTVTGLRSFGTKDHRLPGNAIDASDRDNPAGTGGAIRIVNRPLKGQFMPDGIDAYEVGGQTFLVTANEGDAREYDGFVGPGSGSNAGREDPRLSQIPNSRLSDANVALKTNGPDGLGRTRISAPFLSGLFDLNGQPRLLGDTNGDGKIDDLHVLGARSFSIWDETGNLVFDSGDDLERIIASTLPNHFNANHTETGGNALDARSPGKGPEPEDLEIGFFNGTSYLFVGLERIGGVVVYDISDPTSPNFLQYINPRDFSVEPTSPAAGDLGPEVLTFVSADDSPTGLPLLLVGNEVSGTVTIYQIPEPTGLALAATAGLLALRRRR